MSAEVEARLERWARWQERHSDGLGFPSASIYAQKHRLAGTATRIQRKPLTARGVETRVVKGSIPDHHWTPDIEQTETALSRLRRERPKLAFVLIAEHLAQVPKRGGGWKRVAHQPGKGEAHRSRTLALALRLGPRQYVSLRALAYCWMEAALGSKAA